jgi:hypothetical protein
MCWHHRLGHLSFAKIKALALAGEIPKKLTKVKPPICAGCLYGTMTKVNWKRKEATHGHQVFVATKPGQCVSVNEMISMQVGFIVQLKGMLTKKRYKAVTVIVDHFSCLQYVHLMMTLSSEEMVTAKLAFEQFAEQHGITIQHYYCDNSRFADNDFKLACELALQRLLCVASTRIFKMEFPKRPSGTSRRALANNSFMLNRGGLQPSISHYGPTFCTMHASCTALPTKGDATSQLEAFSSV